MIYYSFSNTILLQNENFWSQNGPVSREEKLQHLLLLLKDGEYWLINFSYLK